MKEVAVHRCLKNAIASAAVAPVTQYDWSREPGEGEEGRERREAEAEMAEDRQGAEKKFATGFPFGACGPELGLGLGFDGLGLVLDLDFSVRRWGTEDAAEEGEAEGGGLRRDRGALADRREGGSFPMAKICALGLGSWEASSGGVAQWGGKLGERGGGWETDSGAEGPE